jgi:UDP-GlcNAc:undecaprenyl-phosphate GlcNAc-1-phosphate transferase
MDYVFALFAGLFMTMVAVPPLVRISTWLHLVDEPNWRTVHESPVPRVGGIAVGVATIIAVLTWVPLDLPVLVYLAAGIWITFFGALDDARNLNYKWKLLAQFPPVILMVQSGVILHHLPFFGIADAPEWISLVVTVVFFLGVINAVNLFDGLDGLAGGCMLLSLAAIAYLGFVVDAVPLVLLSLILIGGILGFLNYNSHPASIFLGDAGSQFLGFSVATFAIMLTETFHTALGPALPFLLLGLPLADTTWVFFLRVSQGKSPFHADKQHLHHQLLNGGLTHGQAVSVVYLFQAFLVGTALSVPYGADSTVIGLLLLESGGALALILAIRRRGVANHTKRQAKWAQSLVRHWRAIQNSGRKALTWIIEFALVFLVLGIAIFGKPFFSRDIAALTLGLAALMGFAAIFLVQRTGLSTRLGFYVAGALAVYVIEPLNGAQGPIGWFPALYLGGLALLLAGAIALTERELFQVSPQDLLVGFIVLAAAALPGELFPGVDLGFMVIAGMILFYACEYLVSVAEHRFLVLRLSTFLALLIIGGRGLYQ